MESPYYGRQLDDVEDEGNENNRDADGCQQVIECIYVFKKF